MLSGCAGTPYQHMGVGGGYSDKEIGVGKWKVRFLSNVASAQGFAAKAALYRSAQVVERAGYPYFAVVDATVHFNTHGGAAAVGGTVTVFSNTTRGQTADLIVVGLRDRAETPPCEAADQEVCSVFETKTVLADLDVEMRNAGRRHPVGN